MYFYAKLREKSVKTLSKIFLLCYNAGVETKSAKLLGVDFGLKRVGLAVCDGMRILATPLPAIKTSSMRMSIDEVARAAQENGAGGIVVGLPLNLDGSESVQSGRARAFARNLEKVSGLRVELFDERLTTVEADGLLKEAGVKSAQKRAELVDSMSAVVILQSYIDNNKTNTETIMAEKKSANEKEQDVEVFDDDEVITLTDDDGNPVDFYEVACIEYKGDFYALMQPVEPMEGLGEDEALIFKVREEDEDNDVFEPVYDESVLEAVFNEYLNAMAEAEEGCDCCECDDCKGEHDCEDEHDCEGDCCEHHHHGE